MEVFDFRDLLSYLLLVCRRGVAKRGPGTRDAEIFFNPALEATSGQLIEVKLDVRADAPVVEAATFVYGADNAA